MSVASFFPAIDENVVNIDFLRRDTRRLYGLARNQVSRLRSDDGGNNWCTISEIEYNMATTEVSEVLRVKTLPFDQWESLSADSLFSQYGFNVNDTVKFSGRVTGYKGYKLISINIFVGDVEEQRHLITINPE